MTKTATNANIHDLHYGLGGVDRLYARVWGDSIHFGVYGRPETDLEGAVVESKRRMAEIASIKPGSRVLEVASGWGATARYLARAHGARVTATNIEADHLDSCRQLAEMAGLGSLITASWADFHRLPFDDKRFDVYWCQEATVHATDKLAVFSEAYRVLRPGGRLVFSDQTTDRHRCSEVDRTRLAARHGSGDLWNGADFRAAMAAAGFVEVEEWDWTGHMALHFVNLVERIERNFDSLVAEIDEDIVRFNLDLWRFGKAAASDGRIGWSCFAGVKP